MKETQWYLYLIEAENGFLYTGISTDPDRRLKEHLEQKSGAKFFRSSPPKKRLFVKGPFDRSTALKLEAKIKKLKPAEKRALKRTRDLRSLLL